MMNTQLYSGFDAFGRVIPTIAHAAQIREIYRRIGQKLQPGTEEWLASAERRGQAFDSAEARDDLPLSGERGDKENEHLTLEYARRLRGEDSSEVEYTHLPGDAEHRAESTRARGSEFQKPMIHTPAEHQALFDEYRRSRGWDVADETLRRDFEMQMYYADRLNESQPLRPLRRNSQREGGF